ncbi:hypothetical protein LTR78_006778 [Recurvomyces mirabilis]|uniref:Uncharacterized protein n=1 Tax=Recurvomyces mirabilis TaxID=574656 RepID=A0AAE0WK90_9PEZI|nr:hypothetical protein LTR78_006778 [Recurvomyces mirabilis]KAK5153232.1 hypothetical protein LTS14_007877 [Recurvomyces mirabilis]
MAEFDTGTDIVYRYQMARYQEVESRRETTETTAAATTDRHGMQDSAPVASETAAVVRPQENVAAVVDAAQTVREDSDAGNDDTVAGDAEEDVDDPDTILSVDLSASNIAEERRTLTSEAHDGDDPEEVAFDIAERLYDILRHPMMPSSEEANIVARRVMRQTLKRISVRLIEYINKANPPRKTGLVKSTRAAINQEGDDDEYQEYTCFDELRTIIGETVIETFWYECNFGEDSESGFSRHYVTDETKTELAMMDKGLKTVILEMTRQISEIQRVPKPTSGGAQLTEDSQIGSRRSFKDRSSIEGDSSAKERKSTGLKSSGDKWEPTEELMCWELFWDTNGKATNRKRAVTVPMREIAFNGWSAKNTKKRTIRQWCAMEQHMNQLIKKDKKTHQEMRDVVGEAIADDISETAKALIDSLDVATSADKAGKSSDSGIDMNQIDLRIHSTSPVSTKRKRRTAEENDAAADDEAQGDAEKEEDMPEPAAKRTKADILVEHGKRSHDTAGWQT